MSHSLNSVKGLIENCIGEHYMGVIEGDSRSLDYGSYDVLPILFPEAGS